MILGSYLCTMSIKKAEFVCSSSKVEQCPAADRPEYAFIGRSNVGKSSLINMLTDHKGLAKTSGKPGKTQLINHFKINDFWYLVDLPGYGFAKVSKTAREKFQALISDYILDRKNLVNLFVLVDSRHKPQEIDMEFMEWLGECQIPFSIVFTKADKLGSTKLKLAIEAYEKEMLQTWAEMPPYFVTSAEKQMGKQELTAYLDELTEQMKEHTF